MTQREICNEPACEQKTLMGNHTKGFGACKKRPTVRVDPDDLDRMVAVANGFEDAVSTLLLNAELGPDPRMGGATDCYHVPTDDIASLRALVAHKCP